MEDSFILSIDDTPQRLIQRIPRHARPNFHKAVVANLSNGLKIAHIKTDASFS